ncbi:MAG: phosphoenolpyruvate hydrolase family protein [Chloroflexi bacterium]|nr:phosphoenolpyruvate hydrolase family protein [Chloroflexota bacterium]
MKRHGILDRFRAQLEAGKPIVGAGAGTRLSAKCVEAGGADLIVIHNSGRFRMAGRGSLAGMLLYDVQAIRDAAADVAPDVLVLCHGTQWPSRRTSNLSCPAPGACHVIGRGRDGQTEISRPHYELALLTTLNEQLKSGDVTVACSHRWTHFGEYLIPRTTWEAEREQHYAALGLPIDSDMYLTQLEERLHTETARVDRRTPQNPALTIDRDKAEFHLARLKASPEQDAANRLKDLLESRMPVVELIDALIDVDNATDFLHYFLQSGRGQRV